MDISGVLTKICKSIDDKRSCCTYKFERERKQRGKTQQTRWGDPSSSRVLDKEKKSPPSCSFKDLLRILFRVLLDLSAQQKKTQAIWAI